MYYRYEGRDMFRPSYLILFLYLFNLPFAHFQGSSEESPQSFVYMVGVNSNKANTRC
jgi:hypothetical protein